MSKLRIPLPRKRTTACRRHLLPKNELSVRVEGGWPPADNFPHGEDLLPHTLGLPPRVKQDNKVYPASDVKRNRLMPQPDSDKKTESDKEPNSTATTKMELHSGERQQFSEDEELPFQEGLPLKEDNINSKICNHDREIFMALLSYATNRESDSTTLEDLDYNEFLSGPETTETAAATCENPPPGITVTVHLDDNPKMILKTEHQPQQLGNSFDYSNNDLHSVINIGPNARTFIINKREDH